MNIPSNHIEACHRVSKKRVAVVIKFSQSKDCQEVLAVKKDLCKTKMKDVGPKLFIHKKLCPYYQVIWSKSKKLHSFGKSNSFSTLGDKIKIKVCENSVLLSITEVDDIRKYIMM